MTRNQNMHAHKQPFISVPGGHDSSSKEMCAGKGKDKMCAAEMSKKKLTRKLQ